MFTFYSNIFLNEFFFYNKFSDLKNHFLEKIGLKKCVVKKVDLG